MQAYESSISKSLPRGFFSVRPTQERAYVMLVRLFNEPSAGAGYVQYVSPEGGILSRMCLYYFSRPETCLASKTCRG